jgi:putative SOS response-associated peptidase YedK
MCGRVKLEGDFSQLKIAFKIPDNQPALNFAASWNVAPADQLPIVRYNDKERHRALNLMRWGLVPYWAKDMKVGFANINAMAETVDTKTAYRTAFARRRCLVPIEAFYEWKKLGPKKKQPYAFALAGGGLMALAGLWENWKSPAGEWVRSFTIVTTTPSELCAEIHDRMPVILPPAAWPLWLGEDAGEPEQLKAVLRPYPAEDMAVWPVSARVGNVKNNDPSLIEPVELSAIRGLK